MRALDERTRPVGERRSSGHALMWLTRHWLRRYLPAELLAIFVATACATLAGVLSNDDLLTIASSVVGSTVAYYGLIVIREIVEARRACHVGHAIFTPRTAFTTVRNLALEFGSAELLDNLLVSPVLLYVFIQAVPNLQIAVVLSEVTSSVAFYTTVVIAHEVRRAFADTAVC